jgi:hypothetical protein
MQNFNVVNFIINALFAIVMVGFGLYTKSLSDKIKSLQLRELCDLKHLGIDSIFKDIKDDIKDMKKSMNEGFEKAYNKIDDIKDSRQKG